jgi:hypothetical protein
VLRLRHHEGSCPTRPGDRLGPKRSARAKHRGVEVFSGRDSIGQRQPEPSCGEHDERQDERSGRQPSQSGDHAAGDRGADSSEGPDWARHEGDAGQPTIGEFRRPASLVRSTDRLGELAAVHLRTPGYAEPPRFLVELGLRHAELTPPGRAPSSGDREDAPGEHADAGPRRAPRCSRALEQRPGSGLWIRPLDPSPQQRLSLPRLSHSPGGDSSVGQYTGGVPWKSLMPACG